MIGASGWRSPALARWIKATLAVALAVSLLATVQHIRTARATREAAELAKDLGEALTALQRGEMALSLAAAATDREPGAAQQTARAVALLHQAIEQYEATIRRFPQASDGEGRFARTLGDLAALLRGPRPPDIRSRELRTLLSELDILAGALDAAAHREILDLQSTLDGIFVAVIVAAALSLAMIAGATIRAIRQEAATTAAGRLSEERFRRLFDHAPLPLAYVDTDGTISALNRQFEQAFGFTRTDTPTAADFFRLAYPDPAYREAVMQRWRAALTTAGGGPSTPGEYRITCKDGSERAMLVTGISLARGTLAAFVDVTEQHRAYTAESEHARRAHAAQREAEASRARLAAALAAMSDAVMICDCEGRLIHVNETFARYHRFAAAADCPRTVAAIGALIDAYHLDGRKLRDEDRQVARALRGESAIDQEYRLVRRDTGATWFGSYTFAPIRGADGRIEGAVLTARDITERKRAEDELHDSREKLQLLIEHAPAALAMFDRDMRYLAVSRRWREDYGVGDRAIIGESHYELFPHIPARWREVHRRGFAGEVVRAEEDRVERPDGSVAWLRWEVRPWYARSGAVGGIGIFTEDITARKQAALEIAESSAKLAQAQKMEAVGQLTGGIAHDFNNILAVITGNLELAEDDLAPASPARATLDTALRATNRGAELTQRLLAFSRRQDLRPRVVDLNMLVGGFVKLLARTLGDDIVIVPDLAPDVDGVFADAGQLENALLNLAINARDAMPTGGTLTLATRVVAFDAARAQRHEIAAGSYEMVAVSDTGQGMAPEIAARAFEPFFTTKAVGKGSGLGLSMVYGFAKQSAGHVILETEPGRGTTVRVYLPKPTAAQAATSGTAAPPPSRRGTGEFVMVVEDNADLRALVDRQLVSLGYRVQGVADGRAALALLQAGIAPDLILTDVVMPGGMSGIDLAAAARALGASRRVLYMSGFAEGARDRRRLQSERAPFLAKPFTRAQLSEAVAHALGAADTPLARG